MSSLKERIEARIKESICHACVFRTAEGGCNMPPDRPCPILPQMDKIIEIVRTTHSDRIDPYVERLREVVCRECRQEDEHGRCLIRAHNDCALDDYYALIVEIVEDELAVERRSTKS